MIQAYGLISYTIKQFGGMIMKEIYMEILKAWAGGSKIYLTVEGEDLLGSMDADVDQWNEEFAKLQGTA
jgi:uncharacterized protein (UPF0218 family)